MDLFSNTSQEILIGGCSTELFEAFLEPSEAESLFKELLELDWKQEEISFMGKKHPIPRLTYWFSRENKSYIYSGIKVEPEPFPQSIEDLCVKIEETAGKKFNSVLLNYYRNGNDSVAWHADDEASLGNEITVASYSLGAERKFQLRENFDKSEIHNIVLKNNSLLIMHHPVQKKLVHQIPKQPSIEKPRINLTFRFIN